MQRYHVNAPGGYEEHFEDDDGEFVKHADAEAHAAAAVEAATAKLREEHEGQLDGFRRELAKAHDRAEALAVQRDEANLRANRSHREDQKWVGVQMRSAYAIVADWRRDACVLPWVRHWWRGEWEMRTSAERERDAALAQLVELETKLSDVSIDVFNAEAEVARLKALVTTELETMRAAYSVEERVADKRPLGRKIAEAQLRRIRRYEAALAPEPAKAQEVDRAE